MAKNFFRCYEKIIKYIIVIFTLLQSLRRRQMWITPHVAIAECGVAEAPHLNPVVG